MNKPSDPFARPLVLFRIGWMNRYRGIASGDAISGGGAYVAEHGFGHEIFNFLPFGESVYGYVQPPGRKDKWSEGRIKLARLGARPEDESLSGVLAVWVATLPNRGAFVVGWYREATVFRAWQSPPHGSSRKHRDTDCGYYVTAKAENAVLIAPDERVFSVSQQGKGGFGRSNIWYADDPDQHRQFRLNLLCYIETRNVPTPPPPEDSGTRQPDPLLRQRVEQCAVKQTTSYFTRLGYRVDSVERDNVGWDLDATVGKRELRLEVKGLSGLDVVVELTPNEYRAMQQHRDSYRVCVVTKALTVPCLEVFAYSPETGRWESPSGRVLDVEEIIAARCSAT